MRYRNGRYIDLGNPVAKHPLNEGLAAWWLPLPNNQGGGTLFDLLGRYNGTLTNGPTWAEGPNGFGALTFDGTNDYVSAAVPTGLHGSVTGTISAWVRGDAANDTGAPLHCSSDLTDQYYAYFGDGKVYLSLLRSNRASGITPVVTLTTWHMLTVTTDGATWSLYQNGVLAGSQTAQATVSATAMRLGRDESVQYWGGRVADVRVYTRCLPAAEVLSLYDQSLRGHPDTLRRRPKRSYGLTQAAPAGGRPPRAAYRMNTNKVIRGL